MSKLIVLIIVVVSALLGVVVGILLPVETNTDYDKLVRHAQRQAVEIAIIEQSSKLTDYKQQLAKMQQAKTQPVIKPVESNSSIVAPALTK